MKPQTLIAGVLCAFCMTGQVLSQQINSQTDAQRFTPKVDLERREKNAQQLGHYAEPGKPYLGLCIPSRISETEFDAIADILELSDAQRLKFRQLYDTYLEEEWEYRKKSIQPLWDRSAELAPLSSAGSVEYGKAYAELFADRDRALKPLFALEDRLLTDMVPYLTEEQLEKLATARNHRARSRSVVIPGKFPGCMIDLLEKLRAVQMKHPDMTPSDPEAFESRAAEYDSAATHLFEMASQRRISTMVENERLRSQAQTILETEGDDELSRRKRRALGLERDSVNEKLLFANRAIHDLNKKYVDVFAQLLPPEHGEELRTWFQRTTYREVYPDPYDLSAMFVELQHGETLTPDQKAVVAVIERDHISRRDQFSEKMVAEYLNWYSHLEICNGYDHAVYEEYRETMKRLQAQREENAYKAIDAVIGMLDENQLADVEAAAAEFRRRTHEFENYRAELARQGREWPRQDG